MFDYVPDVFKTSTPPRGGGRPLVHRRGQQPAPAGAAAPRRRGGQGDQLEVKAGRGSPQGGVYLDVLHPDEAAKRSSSGCRRCTTSSRSWPTSTSTKEPMQVGPTCHYVMGGVEVDPDTGASKVPGLFAAGECSRRHARLEPPRRQLAVRPAGLRPQGRDRRGRLPDAGRVAPRR